MPRKDHVARLFAANLRAGLQQLLKHVFVADRCTQKLNVDRTHRQLEPDIAHNGRNNFAVVEPAVPFQILSHCPKCRVTIHDLAVFIDKKGPISISVECYAEACSMLHDRSLKVPEVERPAIFVNIAAVGPIVDRDHTRSQCAENSRSDRGRSPVGTVEDDLDAPGRKAGDRTGQMCDVVFDKFGGNFDLGLRSEWLRIIERSVDISFGLALDRLFDLLSGRQEDFYTVVIKRIV